VTPVAVMTEPLKCPGNCVYCPTYQSTPQSYTPESPAVLRAIRCDYDAAKQVKMRLKVLTEMGHPTDKVELIVMGGTFLAFPEDYQHRFIKECLDGLNGEESADLEEAKQRNQTARHRCTGLCIETRPDWCGQEEIERMLRFGATRVELGVQMLDDEIYRLTRRGHKVEDVVRATALLRQYGFKVHYHWMPGLPGSTPEHDLELSRQLFEDERFRPDGLNGEESADLEEAKQRNQTARHRCTGLCVETRPDWCGEKEIERMLRFGATRVELGVQLLDDEIYRLTRRGHKVEDVVRATALLRQYGFKVHYHWMPGLPGSTPEHDLELSRQLFEDERFKPDGLKLYPTMVVEGTELERWYQQNRYQPYDVKTMVELMIEIKSIVPKYVRISCIRCREYGHRTREGRKTGEPKLVRMDYGAAGGKEIFLSFEDEGETLFGLLRLRIQPRDSQNSAIIRELHVYGPEVPLAEQNGEAAQHKGLGKALLREAERIAAEEFGARQMTILSGVGAREYYRTEFGYKSQGDYMVRDLGVRG